MCVHHAVTVSAGMTPGGNADPAEGFSAGSGEKQVGRTRDQAADVPLDDKAGAGADDEEADDEALDFVSEPVDDEDEPRVGRLRTTPACCSTRSRGCRSGRNRNP
ncbi:hypothetical protein SBADM41S_11310 [Streptomyces badius]